MESPAAESPAAEGRPAGAPERPAQPASEPPGRPGRLAALAVPNLTVFISSLCIMVVELVAGRLIARHVGTSLYTWTSVIGIVLGGIAAGNYVGGRIADRYRPREALASLFLISSAACLVIPLLNARVGNLELLHGLDWGARIALHVFFVFFVPSALLGTISPVAAKMALEMQFETGRTVGNVYSWGAVGSIAGTFLTGYVLIAWMGTVAVLLSVAGVLLLMALFYGSRSLLTFVWLGVVIGCTTAASAPWSWADTIGQRLGLRRAHALRVFFEEESQYSLIRVLQEEPGVRSMRLDYLIHAFVSLDDPDRLIYDYEQTYAGLTEAVLEGWSKPRGPRALCLGGGGFVFPRWLARHWPESHVEVAEIDPAVTRAAFEAFGLERDTPIQIHNLDARNHVDDLLRRQEDGEAAGFDLVYADAFNHYSPPFHLTTLEFHDKVRRLLSPGGVYLLNIIDIYRSGLFLGATINTLEEIFPHVYAFSSSAGGPGDSHGRDTFVVAASGRPLPLEEFDEERYAGGRLTPEQLAALRQRSRGLVLTDDYAPVDNLLTPVIRDVEGP